MPDVGIGDLGIKEILFMAQSGADALKKHFGWKKVSDIEEGKSAIEFYNEFLKSQISKGKEPKAKDCQVLMNALRLAVEAKRNGDENRVKSLKELQKIHAMTWQTAGALYNAGTTKPEKLERKRDEYVYQETWKLFDKVFETTDLSPDDAYEIWTSIMVALELKKEPPEGIGPPGGPHMP